MKNGFQIPLTNIPLARTDSFVPFVSSCKKLELPRVGELLSASRVTEGDNASEWRIGSVN